MKNQRRIMNRRFMAAVTSACLIAGMLPSTALNAFAADGWDDPYSYEFSQASLVEAIEDAVDSGSLLYEQLDFSGDYSYEYEDLFYQDGSLYELNLNAGSDADRDSALGLRAFVRLTEDVEDDESTDAEEDIGYEADGSEKVIFLIQNKSDEEVTAKIYVDGKESHRMVVLPHDEIIPPAEEETDDASYEVLEADENFSEPVPIEVYEVDLDDTDAEAAGQDDASYIEADEPEVEAVEPEVYEPEEEQIEAAPEEDAEEVVGEEIVEETIEEEPEEVQRVLSEESYIDDEHLLSGTIYDPVCVGDNGAVAFSTSLTIEKAAEE